MGACTERRLRPWLGTYVAIEASMDDRRAASTAIEAAFSEVAVIHAAMSFHASDSELALLHREAHRRPTPVGPHTWAVLTQALHFARISDGVFDPTVAGQLVRLGALPRPEGPAPDTAATWRDIELINDRQVHFHRPLWIDLGGIAKGYAVDRAIDVLQRHGAQHAVVNAGGDLRVAGAPTHSQPLLIRDPADPARCIPLGTVGARAVATSGEFLLGRRPGAGPISPLIGPDRRPRPASSRSVTVVADHCMLADGLTKVVALLGADALPLLQALDAQAAILAGPEDTLQTTGGFWAALGHPVPPGHTHHE
ncbi:FAD:protein FMN transferase [Zoogloea sp.]|uniref:FAD:protein FMN transferase n=1 Tax=Zoogloea sp. TaxID=49181 RepID=UPI002BBF1AEE|nr:FAD:protein FMN transferase [Zoogloea sp.]